MSKKYDKKKGPPVKGGPMSCLIPGKVPKAHYAGLVTVTMTALFHIWVLVQIFGVLQSLVIHWFGLGFCSAIILIYIDLQILRGRVILFDV